MNRRCKRLFEALPIKLAFRNGDGCSGGSMILKYGDIYGLGTINSMESPRIIGRRLLSGRDAFVVEEAIGSGITVIRPKFFAACIIASDCEIDSIDSFSRTDILENCMDFMSCVILLLMKGVAPFALVWRGRFRTRSF